ncbi:MAG: ester cyclase [Methyloceanibacter sp.]|uniref:ester cyclase n=1 Tax=Methyloceanibacter sp. TaxID=1965321 RepID=UPI003D6CF572
MTDAATLAANRLIGRRVLLELWGAGKLEVADELYAPDYVDHVGRGPEASRVVGPEGIKQAVTLFRSAFPDLTYTVKEQMAERDLVCTRFAAQGTFKGPFLGAAPTGEVVRYTGMDLNRIRGGKIVESWVNYDALALLQQVGLVPPVKGI